MVERPRHNGHPRKCGARCRQTGTPCNDWAIPFGFRCRRHGGNTRAAREAARLALLDYLRTTTDPEFVKGKRLSQWRESTRRWEMRRAKKHGPEYVAALLAEWEFEATEKRQWAEANQQARLEAREKWKRENPDGYKGRKPRPRPEPTCDDEPGFIPWNIQTDDWGL